MFLKHLDLTSALRPSLLHGEVLLFTQDNVGLYEDKYKLANYQNGQVYLTSHRICYVDNLDPRKNCIAIELKDVERYEFYCGFLKSSPKITLVPKPDKQQSSQSWPSLGVGVYSNGNASPSSRLDNLTHFSPRDPSPVASATWICPICTFSNLVPLSFDPSTANERTPMTPCSTCGVKPFWAHVLKAAISNATQVKQLESSLDNKIDSQSTTCSESLTGRVSGQPSRLKPDNSNSFQCPRCTFLNHPSLMACELCNSPLISQDIPSNRSMRRTESPGPVITPLAHTNMASIKISFRGGGEKIFDERLRGSLAQRKWLSHGAPPVPTPSISTYENGPGSSTFNVETSKTGGIASLEARQLQERQKNERVIGSAFEDLEALMASAQEILALAESFSSTNSNSNSDSNAVASALGLVTTKEMVGSNSESLYITELTRNLTEFLMDDSRGVLSEAGGIISLVDLWAKFNRARGGVELVSPNDFAKAAHQCDVLKLPFRLRKFKSGVIVVQGNEHTDQKINSAIKKWLKSFHSTPPEQDVAWDWHIFGRGVTAQEAAEHFGWSLGVAEEELEMAEEEGTLCREDGIEGIRFWINYLNPVVSF